MDISIEPYKRITIRSFVHHPSPEVFITRAFTSMQQGTPMFLYWANGILMRYFTYAQTDSVSKEYLNGHLPIDFIDFASMPKYKEEIRVGGYIVTVLDLSEHQVIDPLTKWLSTNFVKKKP